MTQRGELMYQIVGTSANLIRDIWNNVSYSHRDVLNQSLVQNGFIGILNNGVYLARGRYLELINTIVINAVETG